MTEKAVEKVKGVSLAVAEAVSNVAFNLGFAEALAVAGFALLGVSIWAFSQVDKADKVKLNKIRGGTA